jgi:hypothetical protein
MEEPDAWTNLALRCLTAAITLSVLGPGNAQTPTAPQGAAPQAYRPGLGDLMTMTVQPRHTKLGLAGQEKNWTYAAYELHELDAAGDWAASLVAGQATDLPPFQSRTHGDASGGGSGGKTIDASIGERNSRQIDEDQMICGLQP